MSVVCIYDMKIAHSARLEEFGTRSLVTHAMMAVTFGGAVVSGLFVSGEIGRVAFVSMLTFSSGLWMSHSVHSLGNVRAGDTYNGILNEVFDTHDMPQEGFDAGRFGRLLALIAGVSSVSMLVATQRLDGEALAVVAIGTATVAGITAMVGVLIAAQASFGEFSQPPAESNTAPSLVDEAE
jgi:hypothetical protein